MAQTERCPFCTPDPAQLIQQEQLLRALWDKYPVTPGHALIVPRRHIPSLTDANPAERAALFDLVDRIRLRIDDLHHPAGYNIGINEGTAPSP